MAKKTSSTYLRGKAFELDVATMIRKKADQAAKRNKGSHANWHRRSDIFTNLPIHVEAKDHETIKVKEWYRQAKGAAAAFETPVVVFRADEEIMAMLRFDDVLNLFVEIADLKEQVRDMEIPVQGFTAKSFRAVHTEPESDIVSKEPLVFQTDKAMEFSTINSCKAEHIADQHGYCMQLGCKYSRGYRAPKVKKNDV